MCFGKNEISLSVKDLFFEESKLLYRENSLLKGIKGLFFRVIALFHENMELLSEVKISLKSEPYIIAFGARYCIFRFFPEN